MLVRESLSDAVLAAKDCYMAQMILRERCGVVATYDDLPEVLDAILKLEGDKIFRIFWAKTERWLLREVPMAILGQILAGVLRFNTATVDQ